MRPESKHKLYAALLALIMALLMTPAFAFAAEEHMIAIGSDRHGSETVVGEAMSGMPEGVEYVSLIGDLVGGSDDRTPAFDTSVMYGEIQAVFPALKYCTQMSVIWASHDANGFDDAGIMFGRDGRGSGLLKTGYNADRSAAYYIYGIAFYHSKQRIPPLLQAAGMNLH